MVLYEYFCGNCQECFEQITSSDDPEQGKCPKCKGKNAKKLISQFAVGGRGDLRERALSGCHDHSGHSGEASHDHPHDHSPPKSKKKSLAD